jgi:hypothetical protein
MGVDAMVTAAATHGQLQQAKPREVWPMEARPPEVRRRTVLAEHRNTPFTVKESSFPFPEEKNANRSAEKHTTVFLHSSAEIGVMYGCGADVENKSAFGVRWRVFRSRRFSGEKRLPGGWELSHPSLRDGAAQGWGSEGSGRR